MLGRQREKKTRKQKKKSFSLALGSGADRAPLGVDRRTAPTEAANAALNGALEHLWRPWRSAAKTLEHARVTPAKTQASSLKKSCSLPYLLCLLWAAAIGATRVRRGSHRLGMGCCFGPCGPSVDRLSAGPQQVWRHFWVVRDMAARELIEAGLGEGKRRRGIEGKRQAAVNKTRKSRTKMEWMREGEETEKREKKERKEKGQQLTQLNQQFDPQLRSQKTNGWFGVEKRLQLQLNPTIESTGNKKKTSK